MRIKPIAIFFLLCLPIFFASCASGPRVSDVWMDPAMEGVKLEKILVVGIADSDEHERYCEREMAKYLAAMDVQIVPFYKVPGQSEPLSQDEIKALAREMGLGHVFFTHVAGVSEGERLSPSMPQTSVTGRDNFGVYQSQGQAFADMSAYSQQGLVKLETWVVDTNSGKPVWNAKTETQAPLSVYEIMSKLCDTIVNAMSKDGLL